MLVVLAIAVALVFMWAGVVFLRFALQRRRPPPAKPVPPAWSVSEKEGRRRYREAERIANPPTRRLLRVLAVPVGIALFVAPWVALVLMLRSGGSGESMYNFGRVLRIRRNRVEIPAVARGDGWAGDAVVIERRLSDAERSALGEMWLLAARMEHASVAAFSQLGLHLAALGAPARLLEATHRAAIEEIAHARACFAIARAFTGEAHTAGPIHALATTRTSTIDLAHLAIDSLVDGCVAEGVAADVAARGARVAEDGAIRRTLEMIARDEAGHAELAWDVLAWCLGEGGPALARTVAARVDILDRELTSQLRAYPHLDDATLAPHGGIDERTLGELAAARIAAVQARARDLLAARAPVVAAAA